MTIQEEIRIGVGQVAEMEIHWLLSNYGGQGHEEIRGRLADEILKYLDEMNAVILRASDGKGFICGERLIEE